MLRFNVHASEFRPEPSSQPPQQLQYFQGRGSGPWSQPAPPPPPPPPQPPAYMQPHPGPYYHPPPPSYMAPYPGPPPPPPPPPTYHPWGPSSYSGQSIWGPPAPAPAPAPSQINTWNSRVSYTPMRQPSLLPTPEPEPTPEPVPQSLHKLVEEVVVEPVPAPVSDPEPDTDPEPLPAPAEEPIPEPPVVEEVKPVEKKKKKKNKKAKTTTVATTEPTVEAPPPLPKAKEKPSDPVSDALKNHILSFRDPDVYDAHAMNDLYIIEDMLQSSSIKLKKTILPYKDCYSIESTNKSEDYNIKFKVSYFQDSKTPYKIELNDFHAKLYTLYEYHKGNLNKMLYHVTMDYNIYLTTKVSYNYTKRETRIEDIDMRTKKILKTQIFDRKTGFIPT